ncbi:hypothetical protein HY412_01730 [Candidatus Kaiserbacteria bacterium]|nr:hypothetical protein [Candidatus Kaiserbacteria bacterium]
MKNAFIGILFIAIIAGAIYMLTLKTQTAPSLQTNNIVSTTTAAQETSVNFDTNDNLDQAMQDLNAI